MVRQAKVEVDINLGTLETVERILQGAEVPVSRYYIREKLKAEGRATTPARLNRALAYLIARELAFEGSKGIIWSHNPSARLRRGIARGRRL